MSGVAALLAVKITLAVAAGAGRLARAVLRLETLHRRPRPNPSAVDREVLIQIAVATEQRDQNCAFGGAIGCTLLQYLLSRKTSRLSQLFAKGQHGGHRNTGGLGVRLRVAQSRSFPCNPLGHSQALACPKPARTK